MALLPSSVSPTKSTPSRSCWECQRRRKRCDFSRPGCDSCLANQVACPGYEGKKPLTWLAPGAVLSRPRKLQTSWSKQVAVTIKPRNATLQLIETAESKLTISIGRDDQQSVLETLEYCKSCSMNSGQLISRLNLS